jgi:hypothetical protein
MAKRQTMNAPGCEERAMREPVPHSLQVIFGLMAKDTKIFASYLVGSGPRHPQNIEIRRWTNR